MEMQTASDQTALLGQTTQVVEVNGGEDSARGTQVLWEERERRRVEFRSSLLQARNYLSQAAQTLSGCVTVESR